MVKKKQFQPLNSMISAKKYSEAGNTKQLWRGYQCIDAICSNALLSRILKSGVFALILFLLPVWSYAQTNKYAARFPVYYCWGVSAFSGIIGSDGRQIITRETTETGLPILTFLYEPRMNIYRTQGLGSWSAATPLILDLNLYYYRGRMGAITLPVFFDYNMGMSETPTLKSGRGFRAGIGWQMVYSGVAGSFTGSGDAAMFWTQPVVRLGLVRGMRKQCGYIDMHWGVRARFSESPKLVFPELPGSRLYFRIVAGMYFSTEDE
ncbi:MAG: hypothetical protein MUC87_11660 [Bacteroidia bacterium]|nr:hypothetical protein [Bacteroidia bacterium]